MQYADEAAKLLEMTSEEADAYLAKISTPDVYQDAMKESYLFIKNMEVTPH